MCNMCTLRGEGLIYVSVRNKKVMGVFLACISSASNCSESELRGYKN